MTDEEIPVWERRPRCPGVMAKLTADPVWYDGRPILSRHTKINILFGGRGTGKSFFFKVWCLLCAKGETMWVRRRAVETSKTSSTFLDDIYAEGYIPEGTEVAKKGGVIYVDGMPRIRFASLNTIKTERSSSFPGVNWIILDEFVEESKSRGYLQDEPNLLMSLISTVNRWRIGRPTARVFLIGNKVSWFNDYTAYFRIEPFDERFRTFMNGQGCAENYTNPAFERMALSTEFGKVVAGTRYGDFAVYNKSLNDTADFIRRRPKLSEPRANVRIGDTVFGIWTDGEDLYFSTQFDPSIRTYARTEELREREFALRPNDYPVTWLKQFSGLGRLWFDSGLCKTAAYGLILDYWK